MSNNYTITQGDILKWAADYDGEPFHAMLCDPPYHLTEIVKRFGSPGAAPAQFGSDGAFARASRGFMGATWDGGDVAFRPETWAAIGAHLYPGAFGMAFASSRGYHRMAVAIEDAGFIIHPVILCYSYGSGFPKATKPADQIVATKLRAWLLDHPAEAAELRAAREATRHTASGETTQAREAYQRLKQRLSEAAGLTRVVGKRKHAPKFDAAGHGYREKDNGFNSKEREAFDVVEYLDPVAAALAGHRYGLQALKPALEPIIVFQRPYEGRAVDCIAETGAGALWIDGGRLPATGAERHTTAGAQRSGGVTLNPTFTRDNQRAREEAGLNPRYDPSGRWPANLALVHSPLCAPGACVADCPVERIGRQSGERSSGSRAEGVRTGLGYSGKAWGDGCPALEGSTGTAARYFFQADWMHERLEVADHVGYFAKASTAEKEAGLDPAQIALMRLIDEAMDEFDAVTVGDGRQTPIDNPYQRGETERRNTHPTIKPLSLTRWLSTLLLPPERYGPRRLLVPFAGTASEVIGGMLAGWEQVQGVELGEDHVRIARARLTYWQARRHEFGDGRPIVVSAPRRAPEGQIGLFEEAA